MKLRGREKISAVFILINKLKSLLSIYLHTFCLHISCHIMQKTLNIREYVFEFFTQSDRKSDSADYAHLDTKQALR